MTTMSNLIYGCGDPRCLVCNHRRNPSRGWRKLEASRLRRLYPQPSPLQRQVRRPRIIRSGAGLLEVLAREAAQPRFCRNCGDPAPSLADEDWNGPTASGSWRPCPNPSPGRPMIDCGVGGHMYIDSEPRIT